MKKLCLYSCILSAVCPQYAYSSSDTGFVNDIDRLSNTEKSMIRDSLYLHFQKNKSRINEHFCKRYAESFEEITKAVFYCLTEDELKKEDVINFGFTDISNFSIPNLNAFVLYNYMKIVLSERSKNKELKFVDNKVESKSNKIIDLAKDVSNGVDLLSKIEKSISDISYYLEDSGIYEWFDTYYNSNNDKSKEHVFPYIYKLNNDGFTYYIKPDSCKFDMNYLFGFSNEISEKNNDIGEIGNIGALFFNEHRKLRQEYDDAKLQLKTFQEQFEELKKDNKTLSNKNYALENENNSLRNDFDNLTQEKNNAGSELCKLKNNKIEYDKKIDEFNAKLKENDDLHEQFNKLKKEKKAGYDELLNLKVQNTEFQNQIKNLEERLRKAEDDAKKNTEYRNFTKNVNDAETQTYTNLENYSIANVDSLKHQEIQQGYNVSFKQKKNRIHFEMDSALFNMLLKIIMKHDDFASIVSYIFKTNRRFDVDSMQIAGAKYPLLCDSNVTPKVEFTKIVLLDQLNTSIDNSILRQSYFGDRSNLILSNTDSKKIDIWNSFSKDVNIVQDNEVNFVPQLRDAKLEIKQPLKQNILTNELYPYYKAFFKHESVNYKILLQRVKMIDLSQSSFITETKLLRSELTKKLK